MKKTIAISVLATILVAVAMPRAVAADGAKRQSGAPRIRFEWGLTAGVTTPWIKGETSDGALRLSARTGFTVGFHAALRFNKWIALQPEVMYNYTPIRISDSDAGFYAKVKSQAVQVPVLCSFRLWVLRLNFGPVITLTDNPAYRDMNGEKVFFGRVYPTVSYTAGVGVSIMRHLLIDVRYNGRFNKTTNLVSYDAAHEGRELRTLTQSVQLKIGFLF